MVKGDDPTAVDEDGVEDLVEVTFIYDAALGSPENTQPLHNTKYGVPRNKIPLPKRGVLFGQPGFGRQAVVPDPTAQAAPPTVATMVRWEWVLQGGTDPVDAFVDSLTGKGGWTLPASREIVETMVRRLYTAGIPRGTITSQVPPFVQAIMAEARAEDAASPPTT